MAATIAATITDTMASKKHRGKNRGPNGTRVRPVRGAKLVGATGAKKKKKKQEEKKPEWVGSDGNLLFGRIPPNKVPEVFKSLPRVKYLAYLQFRCLCRASNGKKQPDPVLPQLRRDTAKLVGVLGAGAAEHARQRALRSWALSGVQWENDAFLKRVASESGAGGIVMVDKQLENQCRLWFGPKGREAQNVAAFVVAVVVGAPLRTSAKDMQYILQVAWERAKLVSAIQAANKADKLTDQVRVAAEQLAATVFALMTTDASATATGAAATATATATAAATAIGVV
jgi:hypothetical protein